MAYPPAEGRARSGRSASEARQSPFDPQISAHQHTSKGTTKDRDSDASDMSEWCRRWRQADERGAAGEGVLSSSSSRELNPVPSLFRSTTTPHPQTTTTYRLDLHITSVFFPFHSTPCSLPSASLFLRWLHLLLRHLARERSSPWTPSPPPSSDPTETDQRQRDSYVTCLTL